MFFFSLTNDSPHGQLFTKHPTSSTHFSKAHRDGTTQLLCFGLGWGFVINPLYSQVKVSEGAKDEWRWLRVCATKSPSHNSQKNTTFIFVVNLIQIKLFTPHLLRASAARTPPHPTLDPLSPRSHHGPPPPSALCRRSAGDDGRAAVWDLTGLPATPTPSLLEVRRPPSGTPGTEFDLFQTIFFTVLQISNIFESKISSFRNLILQTPPVLGVNAAKASLKPEQNDREGRRGCFKTHNSCVVRWFPPFIWQKHSRWDYLEIETSHGHYQMPTHQGIMIYTTHPNLFCRHIDTNSNFKKFKVNW